MPLSHSVQIKNKPCHDVFDRINHFLSDTRNVQNNYDSFEQAEKAIKKLVGELEKSIVQETLSQYDIDVPIIEYEGKIFHQVIRSEKTYLTAAGKVSLERSLYRADGYCICPLELQAGIIEDFWTPSSARLGCYVSAHLSPYQGDKWDNNLSQLEKALCYEITIPEGAVTASSSLDGIMIPLNKKIDNGYQTPELPEKPTEEEQKEYQTKKEKAFYREASCAAINFYDAEGERLKTVRFGRMPEEGKKTLKNLIRKTMNTIVSKQPDINIIKIADGAVDNWRFLSEQLLPGIGTELLDYFHASDHLNDAFESAYGN